MFLRLIQLLATFLFAMTFASGAGNATASRPNVLLILCDDLRWDSLGCAGHPFIKTPNIDRLAGDGVIFNNMFCTTALSSPSRASLFTGVYAHIHGVWDYQTELPANRMLWPVRLHEEGYETAYIGNWRIGKDYGSNHPGFDTFISHNGPGTYYDTEWLFNGEKREEIKGYYTTVITDLALEWLRRSGTGEKPWVLCLGHKAPHSYYEPEEKYAHAFDTVKIQYPASAFQLDDKPIWIKERRSTWLGIYGPLFEWRKKFPDDRPEAVADFENMTHAYWGTIPSVDDSVGRLVQYLEDTRQLDHTIIIFVGNNGMLNGEHGMVGKGAMHEPSIHVPLIVHYPLLAKGKRVEPQVLNLDIAPSVLELCGAKPLQDIQGKSWVNLVREGDPKWRKSWFYEFNYEKLYPYTPNIRGVRSDDWKYIHYPSGDGQPDKYTAELYHLSHDAGEGRNLAGDPQFSYKLVELQAELSQLMEAGGIASGQDKMPLDEGIKNELPSQKIRLEKMGERILGKEGR